MNDEIKCFGCGAVIQSEDKKNIGYVPKQALESEHILCQRCFRLKHYHEIQSTMMSKDDFLSILQEIGNKDCLVVYMIDIFDFNGSLVQGFARHIGFNDCLVLANKRDILPTSVKEIKLEHWVRRQLKEEGLKPVDVVITSAKKNLFLDEIFDKINDYRKGRDVYVVGMTNVGKSTFINALLKHYTDTNEDNLITVSEFPGTTLNMIEIPLDEQASLYDTPGIINENQITHLLNSKDIKKILPQSELRPNVFQLENQQTLYFGGLGRIDFVQGKSANFITYFSKNLKIHRTKLEKADQLYNNHKALIYEVEGIDTIDQMRTHQFTLLKGKCDIVISGLGFITISSQGGRVDVKVPQGISVILRESLI